MNKFNRLLPIAELIIATTERMKIIFSKPDEIELKIFVQFLMTTIFVMEVSNLKKEMISLFWEWANGSFVLDYGEDMFDDIIALREQRFKKYASLYHSMLEINLKDESTQSDKQNFNEEGFKAILTIGREVVMRVEKGNILEDSSLAVVKEYNNFVNLSQKAIQKSMQNYA